MLNFNSTICIVNYIKRIAVAGMTMDFNSTICIVNILAQKIAESMGVILIEHFVFKVFEDIFSYIF
ncbi:hypothetical protein JMUB4039_1022 [Leptotrichia trevisanii]|nr:hypothetical protein JMUB4039_1022 [Leptotrichia trevisanii]